MGTEAHAQTEGPAAAVADRAPMREGADGRRFWIGLFCAVALHAALIASFIRSPSRMIGDEEGQRDGISVELVEEADLKSRNSVAAPAEQPPLRGTGSSVPPSPASTPHPPSEPAPAPAATEAAAPPVESALPDKLPNPGPSESERTRPADKKAEPNHPAKPKAPLQLSLPGGAFAPGGPGASFERPPGVTRTGENDEFGRGVIRALRKTMPPPTSTLGRVTIRLLLNENGNLQELNLVRGSDYPPLNQSVIFAARQTSYPIPPAGATIADRTFLITYVYR